MMKLRLILIDTHTFYRAATPGRYLCTHSLS